MRHRTVTSLVEVPILFLTTMLLLLSNIFMRMQTNTLGKETWLNAISFFIKDLSSPESGIVGADYEVPQKTVKGPTIR